MTVGQKRSLVRRRERRVAMTMMTVRRPLLLRKKSHLILLAFEPSTTAMTEMQPISGTCVMGRSMALASLLCAVLMHNMNACDAHPTNPTVLQISPTEVVACQSKMEARDLPLSKSRKKAEGKVVGKAAQSFHMTNEENPVFPGCIVRSLILPPRAIKDAESVGACVQVFNVVKGQAGSIKIAFGDPDHTGRRCSLGPQKCRALSLSAFCRRQFSRCTW